MAAGFYWGANNPYLRPIRVRVRRAPKGLNPSIALIGADANPAHIIFECMTNRDWGMGANLGIFDIPSFENAAQTLFDESFGLSMMWTRSTTIEAFITEIVDHVHGTIYVDPRTGRMTFKLLRDDFDYSALRIITPDNAILSNFQRKTWGETANELVVTWANPLNEQEETVAAQDLANISMQGGVISNGRNYYAIRNKDLAARVAERDLRMSSMPLATCDVELNRTLWNIVPGEVFRLQWPEKGIAELIVRAGVLNYGKPGASAIKGTLYEDIFSLPSAQYLVPPDSEWINPGEDPSPLLYTMILTAPAFITAQALTLASPSDIAYPEVITLALGAPDSPDDQNFELIGQVTQPNGDLIYDSFGTREFVGSAILSSAIPAETETTILTFGNPTGASPLVSSIMVLGTGDDESTEFALVKEVTETGWVLSRGILDTVPRAWPIGTRVWTLASDKAFTDVTRRSDGESPEYRFLTRTSLGLLAFDDADSEIAVLTGRPHLPNRPANCKVQGVGFGTFDAAGLTTLSLSWENRNRLLETSQILPWDGGSVSPEPDQTTTVRVLKTDGSVINTYAGLTGTTHTLALSSFGGESAAKIQFSAVRSGFESLQGFEISVVNFAPPAPTNTVAPTISGTPNIGQTLTGTNGTWSGSPTGYAGQWRANGTAISGETGSTYVVQSGDLGKTITYAVTATNAGGSTTAVSTGVIVVVGPPSYADAYEVLDFAGILSGGTARYMLNGTDVANAAAVGYVGSGTLNASGYTATGAQALSKTQSLTGAQDFVILIEFNAPSVDIVRYAYRGVGVPQGPDLFRLTDGRYGNSPGTGLPDSGLVSPPVIRSVFGRSGGVSKQCFNGGSVRSGSALSTTVTSMVVGNIQPDGSGSSPWGVPIKRFVVWLGTYTDAQIQALAG